MPYTISDVAHVVADTLSRTADGVSAYGPDLIIRLANGQAFIFTGKEQASPVEFTD